MLLIIVAPSGLIYHSTVEEVSFPGGEGGFTVLKGHAPLIANLTGGDIVFTESGGKEITLTIKKGFVRVYKDQIEVCVEMPEKVGSTIK